MHKAISIAKKITKKYNLSPGFEIEKLIRTLEIKLEIIPLKSMSGFAYQKNGKKIICVNETDSELRRRFTMAHELGHMLVHGGDDITFDRSFAYFRNDNSSAGVDIKEKEANAFAAELLMPTDHLLDQVRKMGGGLDLMGSDDKIKKLAAAYNVSFSAMSVRLHSLNSKGERI